MSGPPLPRGRHRLSRKQVAENQRERMIAGVAQVLGERGYANLTVEQVVGAAGVSRATFYSCFANREEAVLAATEVAFERLLHRLLRACDAEREWPLKVKAAIGAAVELTATETDLMRLLTSEGLLADRAVGQRLVASREHLAALLSAGRRYSSVDLGMPMITEQALVGAIAAILEGRIRGGEASAEALAEIEPQLVELTLTHYVGVEEASRIVTGKGDLHSVAGNEVTSRSA